MQGSFRKVLVRFIPLLTILLCTSAATAGAPPEDHATAAEVRQEVDAALKAIASYSAGQRDAALAKAKDALQKTDTRIEQLQREIDQNWQDMSEEARKQARETLRTLQKQRIEIAEWYGELKSSSANAWDEIKAGFAKSYEDLETALEKARQKF